MWGSAMTAWPTRLLSMPRMPMSKAKRAGSTTAPAMGGGEYSEVGSGIVVASAEPQGVQVVCGGETRLSPCASLFETDFSVLTRYGRPKYPLQPSQSPPGSRMRWGVGSTKHNIAISHDY